MRLYKVEITSYPDDRDEWRPANWLSDPERRAEWVERHGDDRFYWPSTNRIYKARSSAKGLADLIESYGATVVILEAEPVWVSIEEANAYRKRQRNNRRIAALEARIAAIREGS